MVTTEFMIDERYALGSSPTNFALSSRE